MADKKFRIFINRIIKKYLDLNPLGLYLYGSHYTGNKTLKSDIDLILICNKKEINDRKVIMFDKTEVHLNILSIEDLEQDALYFKYGSIYISKFINPYTILYSNELFEDVLKKLLCRFLENYVICRLSFNKSYTIDQFIAITYLTHISNFPNYILPLSKWIGHSRSINVINGLKHFFKDILTYSNFLIFSKGEFIVLRENPHLSRISLKLMDEIIRVKWWYNYQKNRNYLESSIDYMSEREKNMFLEKERIEKTYTTLQEMCNGREYL